jgi:predicted nucleic acid-binding Zn ribbon protein
MISYGYICTRCLNEFEEFYKMGTAPQYVPCSKCNGNCQRNYKINVSVPNPTHDARKGRGKG